MFLRFNRRFKDGKEHRYWNIVENKRCAGGKVVQRQVLYLGEINDGKREAWCELIEAFDEGSRRHRQLALFPADREVAACADGYGVQVRLKQIAAMEGLKREELLMKLGAARAKARAAWRLIDIEVAPKDATFASDDVASQVDRRGLSDAIRRRWLRRPLAP